VKHRPPYKKHQKCNGWNLKLITHLHPLLRNTVVKVTAFLSFCMIFTVI